MFYRRNYFTLNEQKRNGEVPYQIFPVFVNTFIQNNIRIMDNILS